MTEDLLSIGQVAARTGTATSALRYYEQLGLVRPLRRESGRRRYAPSAIQLVGVVIFFQQVGFTLREVGRLLDSHSSAPVWRELAKRKLGDLDRQIGKAQAARNAIEHALSCPEERILDCPNFWVVVRAVIEGKSLEEAHSH
jgi:MerR family redox-sensitive transcriptional activator SoxR